MKVAAAAGVVGLLAVGALAVGGARAGDGAPSFAVPAAESLSSHTAGVRAATPRPAAEVVVYKSPTCGCCSLWVDHLRANGFTVVAHDTSDMAAVKRRLGVPAGMESCHTAVVDGYVVEGHVPAADVTRLLAERPAVAGVAVPGMPMGAPGMEGARTDRYDVMTFDRAGRAAVFSSH